MRRWIIQFAPGMPTLAVVGVDAVQALENYFVALDAYTWKSKAWRSAFMFSNFGRHL